jgi:hypothetical protein
MVTTNLRTYNNLQLLINFIGQCELPTKCATIVSDNDSNVDGNVYKSFTTLKILCKIYNISFECVLTCCAPFIGIPQFDQYDITTITCYQGFFYPCQFG